MPKSQHSQGTVFSTDQCEFVSFLLPGVTNTESDNQSRKRGEGFFQSPLDAKSRAFSAAHIWARSAAMTMTGSHPGPGFRSQVTD